MIAIRNRAFCRLLHFSPFDFVEVIPHFTGTVTFVKGRGTGVVSIAAISTEIFAYY